MKTAIALLILALTASTVYAQDASCEDYNRTTQKIQDNNGNSGHISGDHVFAGAADGTCDYEGTGNPSCATAAYMEMYVGASDSGVLTTIVGYHVSHDAVNWGSNSNDNGGTSASGTGIVAFEWCLTSTCVFSVSASPVSFPSTAVAAYTQTAAITCSTFANPDGGGGGGSGGTCSCDDPECGDPECTLYRKALNPAGIVNRGDQKP
ncbi:MAG: hypothetical protein WCD47_02585 [Candidatus Sulfotelmatobacter sp.]